MAGSTRHLRNSSGVRSETPSSASDRRNHCWSLDMSVQSSRALMLPTMEPCTACRMDHVHIESEVRSK